MDVLFITHYTDMLGANRSLLQLIIELKRKGVNSTVMLPVCANKSGLVHELQKNNIKYFETPLRWIKHRSRWKSVGNYFLSKIRNYLIVNKLDIQKFDIVHSNSSVIDIGVAIASKLKARHVWHLREFGDIDYNLKTPFGKWFQRHIYKGKHEFIAISRKIYENYLPYVQSDSLHLIYNGVIPTSQRTDHLFKNDKIHFCIVGLLHRNKGQIEVIKAMDELINRRRILNIHLTIIGDGEISYREKLFDYVNDSGLTSYIDFTGFRNDVSDILKRMDIGITASSNEAFGRVTIEYMMAGLAVIVSDSGANEEIVQDGKSGVVYPSGDSDALADRMENLIKNPILLENLAINGHEVAMNTFSASANAENIYNLYKQILS